MAEIGSDRGLIYIIDDDVSFREAIEGMVVSFGYRARSFGSAGEFLRQADHRGALCLIIDVRMAGMNGLDLQAALTAQGSSPPTIFVSSVDDQHVRARALDRGAIAFFGKPFDRNALMAQIDRLAAVERV